MDFDWSLDFKAVFAGLSFVASAISLAFVSVTFYATQKLNQKRGTVDLLKTWNNDVRKHLESVSDVYPQFILRPDVDRVNQWCLKAEEAAALAHRDSADEAKEKERKMLNNALICLLNYFETAVVACDLEVVDAPTMKEFARPMAVDLFASFLFFIVELNVANRRDPWPPLTKQMEEWLKDPSVDRHLSAELADCVRKYIEVREDFDRLVLLKEDLLSRYK